MSLEHVIDGDKIYLAIENDLYIRFNRKSLKVFKSDTKYLFESGVITEIQEIPKSRTGLYICISVMKGNPFLSRGTRYTIKGVCLTKEELVEELL